MMQSYDFNVWVNKLVVVTRTFAQCETLITFECGFDRQSRLSSLRLLKLSKSKRLRSVNLAIYKYVYVKIYNYFNANFKCNWKLYKEIFIPRTSATWNSLLSSCFPDLYDLQVFKKTVNDHLSS